MVERLPERSVPLSQPVESRDALFDAPYVPSAVSGSASAAPAVNRQPSKKPVAALFRSPVKSEPTE